MIYFILFNFISFYNILYIYFFYYGLKKKKIIKIKIKIKIKNIFLLFVLL